MPQNFPPYPQKVLWFFLLVASTACSGSKDHHSKEYDRIWHAMIMERGTTENTEQEIAKDANPSFEEQYEFWVRQAYFKLLAEAEEAEGPLQDEYTIAASQAALGRDNAEAYLAIRQKYETHQKMLEGLSSWKIFSKHPTGDQEWFMKEYRSQVMALSDTGHEEGDIVQFLMHRLADLYHNQVAAPF